MVKASHCPKLLYHLASQPSPTLSHQQACDCSEESPTRQPLETTSVQWWGCEDQCCVMPHCEDQCFMITHCEDHKVLWFSRGLDERRASAQLLSLSGHDLLHGLKLWPIFCLNIWTLPPWYTNMHQHSPYLQAVFAPFFSRSISHW